MKIEQPGLEGNTEGREKPVISQRFFELQLAFARALFERLQQLKQATPNLRLIDVVRRVAPAIKAGVFSYDEERGDFAENLNEGVTEENLVAKAYESYLAETKGSESTPPVEQGGGRSFGPLYYVVPEDQHAGEQLGGDNITFHFANNHDMKPRELLDVEQRRKDMANLLRDIKAKHPNTKTLSTASWLLDAIPDKVMRQLFPQSFLDSMEVKPAKTGWSMGTMIWGQFLNASGEVKEKLAEELMKNVRGMKEDEYLIDLLRPPLYMPKSGMAPIEDFYKMYQI